MSDPITGWKITVPGAPGWGGIAIQGLIYEGEADEVTRIVGAMADGLRRAGYTAEVELTRSTTERI